RPGHAAPVRGERAEREAQVDDGPDDQAAAQPEAADHGLGAPHGHLAPSQGALTGRAHGSPGPSAAAGTGAARDAGAPPAAPSTASASSSASSSSSAASRAASPPPPRRAVCDQSSRP